MAAGKEAFRDLTALKQLTREPNETACPSSVQFSGKHRAYVVAIGKDHTATVYLSDDDAAALEDEFKEQKERHGYG